MNLLAVQRSMREHLIRGSDDIRGQIRGDSLPRLAVYHHAYRAQLLACLRDTYERVWAWLGDSSFEAAASSHIESTPPHSWTLSDYGNDFDRTLRGLYPDDREVAELAWLDWSLRRAFDGPDATPIGADAFAEVDWNTVILRVAPTLRVSSIATNCAALWTAIAEGRSPPAAARLPVPAALRVWRQGLSPQFRSVDSIEMRALLMAAEGASFATICAAIAARRGVWNAHESAGAMLAGWLRDGLIVGVEDASELDRAG